MNEKNLRPFSSGTLTHEEAVRFGKKGGVKSGEARRERKRLKEELETLLSEPMPKKKGMTIQKGIALSLIREALCGNVRAFETIRDTIGERPADLLKINTTPDYSALDEAFEALARGENDRKDEKV